MNEDAVQPVLHEPGKRDKPLCWASPSLTMYLPEAPDARTTKAALEVYQAVCPPDRQTLVTGTAAPAFTKLSGRTGAGILAQQLALMDRRKDQAIAIWDGELTDSWYFTMWGVPPEQGKQKASFCKITFPNGTEPGTMLRCTLALAHTVPFLSGHGGLTAQFDADNKKSAFDRIFAWAKRYPGLEVEDLNVTVEYVRDGLKSVNWLTLVGKDLWARLKQLNKGARATLAAPVEVTRTEHGAVICAGPAPVLGDRNNALVPRPYLDVARALAPLFLKEHGEFPGKFQENEATLPWLHRLLTEDGWRW